jgi:hypothetical protein
MSENIKIYRIKDFIRFTKTGKLDLHQSINLVRELSFASDFHLDHNILLDLREADPFFSGKATIVEVGFDDPPASAKSKTTEEAAMVHYCRVRDEIRAFGASLSVSLMK